MGEEEEYFLLTAEEATAVLDELTYLWGYDTLGPICLGLKERLEEHLYGT